MNVRNAVNITLFVIAICFAIVLIVFWNIYIIRDYLTIRDLHAELHGSTQDFSEQGRWVVLGLGIAAGVLLIVALSLFFAGVMRGNILKRQQRDFTNMMTHELRLPLSGIQIFAQTLRQRPLETEERNKFADGILSECARLGQLIDQLLKIQQMEHHQLLLHKQILDAGHLVREFAAKWPRPLTVATAEGLRVDADPLLLEMCLTNLVTNAEKYGRGSTPALEVGSDDADKSMVRFAVRDGGRPLDRKYLKKVFRKFYRVPNLTTRRQGGVGLGLYIVKSIARLHKGDAEARAITAKDTAVTAASAVGEAPMSSPVEGNEFSFRIPLKPYS
jgi:signal transduction histidine kinase